MAELKTKKTDASVIDFIESVKDKQKKADSYVILEMMRNITKENPKMWGSSIIGFGYYHYKYASGRESDWFKVGFSPRKQNISLYLTGCGAHKFPELLKKLGKHKTGVGCLYIYKLSEVDKKILNELIKNAVKNLK